MNKDNALQYIPLLQALAEGKTLEFKYANVWKPMKDVSFGYPPDKYRIKPEPALAYGIAYEYQGKTYRNYFDVEKSRDQCFDDWKKFTDITDLRKILMQEVL